MHQLDLDVTRLDVTDYYLDKTSHASSFSFSRKQAYRRNIWSNNINCRDLASNERSRKLYQMYLDLIGLSMK